MQSIQTKINKLLLALRMKGIVYKMNTSQFYSEEQQKILTKMIIWEDHPNRDGEVFYSKVKLLKYLAERWKEVNEDGSTEKGENGGTGRDDE